jgi:hypothetical protein
MLVYFIYAVLGVFLFKSVTTGLRINEYNNFMNFGYAMLLLFRSSTGEDWYLVMWDLIPTSCNYYYILEYY